MWTLYVMEATFAAAKQFQKLKFDQQQQHLVTLYSTHNTRTTTTCAYKHYNPPNNSTKYTKYIPASCKAASDTLQVHTRRLLHPHLQIHPTTLKLPSLQQPKRLVHCNRRCHLLHSSLGNPPPATPHSHAAAWCCVAHAHTTADHYGMMREH